MLDESDETFIRDLANNTFTLLVSKSKQKRKRSANLYATYLATLINILVYQSLDLEHKEGTSKGEQYKRTKKNYEGMKFLIQEAVCTAFSTAMKSFTGKDLSFYCLIKTEPDEVSKVTH
jgi:hypothetical protein